MDEISICSNSLLSELAEEIPAYEIPRLAKSLGLRDAYNRWKPKQQGETSFEGLKFLLTSWKGRHGSEANFIMLTSVLNTISCQKAAVVLQERQTILKRLTLNRSSTKVFFNCLPQYLGQRFYGRVKELSQLNSLLTSRRRLAFVTGLGGIGKSSLVNKFAEQNKAHRHCLLFRAEDSSTLQNDIFMLGEIFGIQANTQVPRFCNLSSTVRKRSTAEILELSIQNIRSRTSAEFLLIFDNVRDEHTHSVILSIISSLRKFEDIYICVTARESKLISGRDIVYMSIVELDTEDSMQFVREELPNESAANALKLCKRLNNLPLGLVQAIGYIKHQHRQSLNEGYYTMTDFIQDLNRNPQVVLDRNYDAAGDTRTLLTIWDINFKQLQERPNEEACSTALHILKTLSFVNPDGIELQTFGQLIFCELEESHSHALSVKKFLELLKSLSLIRSENNIISIHRLVQEVVRIKNDIETSTIHRVSANTAGNLQQ